MNGDFYKQMKTFQASLIEVMEDRAEALVHDVIDGVIQRSPHPSGASLPDRPSPFSEGVYLNNWQVDTELNDYYTESTASSKESKASALKKQATSRIKAGADSLYVFINSPYASRVEYFGWSDKSGAYFPILNTVNDIKNKG